MTKGPTLAIALLSVAAFASAANVRVIDPLLVQLSATFDVSVGEASIAATAFLFANGVFVLVHGPFGDRYGKMPVVAIACLTAALCCLLSALADSLVRLAAARFLTGVTSSAIIPLAIAWLGDGLGWRSVFWCWRRSMSRRAAPWSPSCAPIPPSRGRPAATRAR